MSALDAIADWPVPTAAAAVIGPSGVLAEYGDAAHRFATGVGDQAAGRARRADRDRGGRARVGHPRGPAGVDGAAPAGAHLRLLDAHRPGDVGAGKAPDLLQLRIRGGSAEAVANEAGIEFGRYLAEAVFEPLGMTSSELEGGAEAAGYGATSTVADLAAFAGDLLRPALVSAEMHAEATKCSSRG